MAACEAEPIASKGFENMAGATLGCEETPVMPHGMAAGTNGFEGAAAPKTGPTVGTAGP